jgi:cupin fold WbuC family metalloprotein
MIKIDSSLMDSLSSEAKVNTRKRINYNFHKHNESRFQRMLNAMEPGTYIRPHKHKDPDKVEVFIALRGKLKLICFDEQGNIINSTILELCSACCAAEVPAGTWHTIISLANDSVVYEGKDGPYHPDTDKKFATWAPEEHNPDVESYLLKLIESY